MRRRFWGACLAAAILLLGMAPPIQSLGSLPSTLYLLPGEPGTVSLPASPLFQARVDQEEFLRLGDEPLSTRWQPLREGELWATAPGKARLEVAFLGLLPVASLEVEARPTLYLSPGGEALGVILRGTGVTVVDETALRGPDGVPRRPAFEAGIRPGDRLVAVEGVPVERKEDAAARIRSAIQKGDPVELELERGGRTLRVQVPPVYDVRAQRYLIGLWIRDGASGVGTLTFVDPRSGTFAALGHVVMDERTRQPFPTRDGAVVAALVTGVHKASAGSPGEKRAVFLPQEPLGYLTANTPLGIFGQWTGAWDQLAEPLPVARPQEVEVGPALLRTVLQGNQVEEFQVVIERVQPQMAEGRGLVIRVTDPRLLEEAGGIVQGMSGSPIIQGGKLVGAVTHVFVHDPTRGYGTFAYWMAEAAGLFEEER